MARKASFVDAAIRVGMAIAAARRRAQNAAIRQHKAELRHQAALDRQYKRERLAQEKEDAIQYAFDKTKEAEEKRVAYASIIKASQKNTYY